MWHYILQLLFLAIMTSYFCAKCRTSDVPIIPMASSILLHILVACPAPCEPQWMTFLPIKSNTGLARSNDSLNPPTIKVNTPLVAAPTPDK